MHDHATLAQEIAKSCDTSLDRLPVDHPLRFLATRIDSAAHYYLENLQQLVSIAIQTDPTAKWRATASKLHNWHALISEALAYKHFERLGFRLARPNRKMHSPERVFCWRMSKGQSATRLQFQTCVFDPYDDTYDIHIDFFLRSRAANTASGGVSSKRRHIVTGLDQLRKDESNILWIETAHSFEAQGAWIEAEAAFRRRPELSGIVLSTFAYFKEVGSLWEASAECSSILIANPAARFRLSDRVLQSFQLLQFPWSRRSCQQS